MAITANVELKDMKFSEAYVRVSALLNVYSNQQIVFRYGTRLYYNKEYDCVNYAYSPSSNLVEYLQSLEEKGKVPSARGTLIVADEALEKAAQDFQSYISAKYNQ